MSIEEKNIIWKPQPGAQVKAMTAPSSVFEILIHGNRGGGKTDVLLMMFAQHVGRGWGASWKGVIFRETFPNLQDIISKSQKWFHQIFPDAVYNKGNHAWYFKTGEILYFRHARTIDNYWSYHGHEYPFVAWEELTNWPTDDLYMMMMSVCRSSDERVIRRYVSTCNPWGKGHNWVKSRFIDAGAPGQIISEVIKKEDLIELGVPAETDLVTKRTHIKSMRQENLALMQADPTYVLKISQNTNEAIRKAWIDGDWDILAGGMFDDLWNPKVHVIKPFVIPRSWKVYRTFDWGLSKPFAVVWFAVSDGSTVIMNDGTRKIFPRGTAFAIAEWYGSTGKANEGLKLTNVQIGRGIREREDKLKKLYDIDKISKGPADASIFGSESDGEDIAGKISKAFYNNNSTTATIFLPSNKAPGTRIIGWQLLRDKLEAALNEDMETAHIYWFDTCKDWVRTVRLLPRDDKNPDDVDTESEDHLADAVRYFCLFVASKAQMQRFALH